MKAYKISDLKGYADYSTVVFAQSNGVIGVRIKNGTSIAKQKQCLTVFGVTKVEVIIP